MVSTQLSYSTPGAISSRFSRGVRTRSHEALNTQVHSNHASIDIAPTSTKMAKQAFAPLPKTDGKARPVSRLELLLVSRATKLVFTPEEQTAETRALNKAIEMSAQWTDVQDAILTAPVISFNNLAFAMYRLGCLSAFDSKKRKIDLQASNLIPQLFEMALTQIDSGDAASIALLLDGCARLQHRPDILALDRIAALISKQASALDARQLSLVLWAFSTLDYKPGSQILAVLEAAISSKACDLPPQGVTLVLTSFHTAQHILSQPTLTRLADVIQRKLLLFKPSELASSLKTLSAAGFKPTTDFIEALQQVASQSQNAASQGSPSLRTGYNLSLVS